jgi:hypothetical protein
MSEIAYQPRKGSTGLLDHKAKAKKASREQKRKQDNKETSKAFRRRRKEGVGKKDALIQKLREEIALKDCQIAKLEEEGNGKMRKIANIEGQLWNVLRVNVEMRRKQRAEEIWISPVDSPSPTDSSEESDYFFNLSELRLSSHPDDKPNDEDYPAQIFIDEHLSPGEFQ